MNHFLKPLSQYLLLSLLLLVAACQPTPPPGLKLGKPYVVEGRTYYPEYDPTYDKIGMASWYGPGFHGRRTASGEVYNQNDLTAAHPTLPMGAMVRVTNLANGKSIIVRINDRGPFKSNRIIDLSKRAAEKISMPSTMKVRVQFLEKETKDFLETLNDGGKSLETLADLNAKASRKKEESILRSTQPENQIVESSDASTHSGQTVQDAAPIMTVSSGDIGNNSSAPKPTSSDIPFGKASKPLETLAPSSAGSGKFYIQAGSFSAEENAQKLSAKIASAGPVDVAKVEMGDKVWWRVRVGPFLGQEEASEALEKIVAANVQDARIIHQ